MGSSRENINNRSRIYHKGVRRSNEVVELPFLEDELLWAKDRLPYDGVMMKHILSRFKIYHDVVNEIIPVKYTNEVNYFIDWMITRQNELTYTD